MTTPALQAIDLTRTDGRGATRFTARKGVSPTITAGESVAIIGESGALPARTS